MKRLMNSKTLTVSIDAKPAHIYRFVSNPDNLPCWAVSFARKVTYKEYDWTVETLSGTALIRFVMPNTLGVMDHVITLSSGIKILNSMRVIPNGKGSEVILTVFQPDDLCSTRFESHIKATESDLLCLKQLLEMQKHAKSK